MHILSDERNIDRYKLMFFATIKTAAAIHTIKHAHLVKTDAKFRKKNKIKTEF